MSSAWDKVIDRPAAQGHLVQIYDEGNERSLVRNVGRYLAEGLRAGDGLLVIAGAEHNEAFRRELDESGADTACAIREGWLKFFDAQETLAKFMVGGNPDWRRFEAAVGAAMRQVRKVDAGAGMRAYGEMVGILWKARQFSAAIRLEQFWNKLLSRSTFSLYCAYSIDVFGKEFQVSALDGVLCTHTHLVPAETNGNLEAAMNRAMEQVLGEKASALRVLIKANYRPSWALMPTGEAIALWLRNNLPNQSDEILGLARQHYHALQAQS